jgi:4-amino-4-deoxy-L-arabinose transferase-like glycosyltransferase
MYWLIGVTILVKVVLSFFLELGNDEVYYYTYAVQPDWNHFDHPGMVGWMMRLTSLNLHWVSTLSMRLGSIICAGLATMVIFKTGSIIKDEKAGYFAAWMYTLSIYTSIIAGLFVLPDSPQLLFFTLSIYWMTKFVMHPLSFKTKHWLLLGLLIGLATLSKVHGLYLWFGFGAFVLFHQIKTLKNARVYIAILITLLCILPIVYWNFKNNFITYRYHSQRVMHTGLLLDSFLQQIVGEIIYQNPLVYLAAMIALFNIKKIKLQLSVSNQNQISNKNDSVERKMGPQTINLLLWLSLPLIFTFWTLSLFNPTLPHWTGPGFIGLFIIAGVYWSQRQENNQKSSNKSMPLVLKGALGLLGASILGFLLLVYIFPRQMGSTKIENLGEYNPINDVTGWESFTQSFAIIAAQDKKLGLMQDTDPIITHKWFPGGHILFYTARPLNKRVIAIGSLEDIHKFAWLNKAQLNKTQLKNAQNTLEIGENAYCIVPSNLPADPHKLYGNYFETISKPDTIPMISKGVLLRNFYVYRLIHCKQIPGDILKN